MITSGAALIKAAAASGSCSFATWKLGPENDGEILPLDKAIAAQLVQ
jgi:hypothetical protein